MKRLIGTIALASIAVAGMAACEPPPPPPVLVVNDKAYGDDANPGDGICETSPGNGICTLDAAIQEANALGEAVIQVPEIPLSAVRVPYVISSTSITGRITIVSTYAPVQNPMATIEGPGLHVHPGASLELLSILYDTVDVERSYTTVDGSLLLDKALLRGEVDIHPTGQLTLVNSFLMGHPATVGRAAVINEGRFVALYSASFTSTTFIDTRPGASSKFAASGLTRASQHIGPDCTGEPAISLGYNLTTGCGFDQEGDAVFDFDDPMITVDRIPADVLACESMVDSAGDPRPVAYHEDGDPACDIGPVENQPGSIVVPEGTGDLPLLLGAAPRTAESNG